MASGRQHLFSILPVCFVLLLSSCCSESSNSPLRTYIVHVHKPPPEHTGTHRDWHESFLPSGPSRLVYSYGHIFSGFAARLTEEEVEGLRKMDGFVHAEPERVLSLHTTYTPTFLQLLPGPTGFWGGVAGYGKGVIIGVLDTGISPTHPSFDDTGMPPLPARWKGKCEFPNATLCNNKLIGARSFNQSDPSSLPFDVDGHGTHTAGTAAGRFVPNASILGNANGTAAGMAPEAYVAMYKVCNSTDCPSADILAGMERAVLDGVDIISLSLGGPPAPFYGDPIAIASFGAMEKGVFVSASAGNDGPSQGTVGNVAPWMLTVGASTTDRRIRAVVKLGDGMEFEGESAYQPTDFPATLHPLAYPQSAYDSSASLCSNATTLERAGVKGKVVVCVTGVISSTDKGANVKAAGGIAMILMSSSARGYETRAQAHLLPTSHVAYADGLTIRRYINSTLTPTATVLFKGTVIGEGSAPAVAAFSSRGPNIVSPGLLKPDVIGPGVNILAAWPTSVGPFPLSPPFNMISGTSMSCPHLTGVAALLKSAHPDYSPAMIKSAIITTTDLTTLDGGPIVELWQKDVAGFYDMGAGHVNPLRATNPGLVYDVQVVEYIAYLCGLGYTDAQVRLITRSTVNCSRLGKIDEVNLNYPSFAVAMGASTNSSVVVNRTVTNVGEANSTYIVVVARPFGVTVDVQPGVLSFTSAGQKEKFTVRFGVNGTEATQLSTPLVSQGFLTWVLADASVRVRSPISVTLGSSSSQLMAERRFDVTLH